MRFVALRPPSPAARAFHFPTSHNRFQLCEQVRAAPESLQAFIRAPDPVRTARRVRDAEMEQTMGGVRDDLQRARAIIAERGLRGLLEALDRNPAFGAGPARRGRLLRSGLAAPV